MFYSTWRTFLLVTTVCMKWTYTWTMNGQHDTQLTANWPVVTVMLLCCGMAWRRPGWEGPRSSVRGGGGARRSPLLFLYNIYRKTIVKNATTVVQNWGMEVPGSNPGSPTMILTRWSLCNNVYKSQGREGNLYGIPPEAKKDLKNTKKTLLYKEARSVADPNQFTADSDRKYSQLDP